jgi:hypothetical protein
MSLRRNIRKKLTLLRSVMAGNSIGWEINRLTSGWTAIELGLVSRQGDRRVNFFGPARRGRGRPQS